MCIFQCVHSNVYLPLLYIQNIPTFLIIMMSTIIIQFYILSIFYGFGYPEVHNIVLIIMFSKV